MKMEGWWNGEEWAWSSATLPPPFICHTPPPGDGWKRDGITWIREDVIWHSATVPRYFLAHSG